MPQFFIVILTSLVFLSRATLADEATFKIGALLCMTSECAEWGNNSLRGAELAVDEINASGGILGRKIKLVLQDTREGSSGATAVSAFQQMRSLESIQYYLGPTWSAAGVTLGQMASKVTDIIMISPSLGVADFNEAGDNLFNTWPHDDISTRALAKHGVKLGWKRAAIFSSQQPWELSQGNAFTDEIRNLGGEVVEHVLPLPDAVNLKAEALRIKQSNPDVVLLSNTNRLGLAAKELRRLGYKGPMFALLLDQTRILDGGGALEGTITAHYPETVGEFHSKYEKRYQSKPGITADTAYDTVHLFAKAIAKAGSFEVSLVKQAIAHMEFEGASGLIKFDSKGGVVRDPIFSRVNGAKLEPLQ